MVAELRKTDKSLYETDYNLWVLETVDKLQRRDLGALDWENLIEEVMDLSRRDKRKLASLLTRLIEHLLKIAYWRSERERNENHWKGEIVNFRIQIRRLLKDSPSLSPYLDEIFLEVYGDAAEILSQKSGLSCSIFTQDCVLDLERVLEKAWFPETPED